MAVNMSAASTPHAVGLHGCFSGDDATLYNDAWTSTLVVNDRSKTNRRSGTSIAMGHVIGLENSALLELFRIWPSSPVPWDEFVTQRREEACHLRCYNVGLPCGMHRLPKAQRQFAHYREYVDSPLESEHDDEVLSAGKDSQ